MKKRLMAFTLAEAVITMMILGIIAAISINLFRPNNAKEKSLLTLKQKVYASVDEATLAVLTRCTPNMRLSNIHDDCDTESAATHSFGEAENVTYAKYMVGTAGAKNTANGNCAAQEDYTSLSLKNGACLYFKPTEIYVDVNGSEGPNDDTDRFTIGIGTSEGDGVITSKPE